MTDKIESRINNKDKRKVARHKWGYIPTSADPVPSAILEKKEETKDMLSEIKSWFKGE
jgi:hypothetical protein